MDKVLSSPRSIATVSTRVKEMLDNGEPANSGANARVVQPSAS
ncbi:hypothetical protein [Nocardia mangyaensis]|nr:hypothetical protein [Nocardia mangyaensis]MDO3645860.1 hypothetical protein [Nocardia mangyaensis]